MNSKILRTNLLIHLFALAHALVVLSFRYFGIPDDIPLTVLTILMIIFVARTYEFPIDISAALALLFCFAGFFMGTKGAEILPAISNGVLVDYANVITTVVVTEILGWCTYFIAHKQQTHQDKS